MTRKFDNPATDLRQPSTDIVDPVSMWARENWDSRFCITVPITRSMAEAIFHRLAVVDAIVEVAGEAGLPRLAIETSVEWLMREIAPLLPDAPELRPHLGDRKAVKAKKVVLRNPADVWVLANTVEFSTWVISILDEAEDPEDYLEIARRRRTLQALARRIEGAVRLFFPYFPNLRPELE